ncbi:MAG: hypothetical protein R3E41_12160 [Burkholderiaceae bacterium]
MIITSVRGVRGMPRSDRHALAGARIRGPHRRAADIQPGHVGERVAEAQRRSSAAGRSTTVTLAGTPSSAAGERVAVTTTGASDAPRSVDPASAAAWRACRRLHLRARRDGYRRDAQPATIAAARGQPWPRTNAETARSADDKTSGKGGRARAWSV